jgi:hypothetical protein
MSFVVEVITIGGGLQDYLGAYFSGRVFSAPVVSVFMPVVLRDLKLTNGTCFTLYIYSLSTDHAENIASNSSYIVAWAGRLAMALKLVHAYKAVAYQQARLSLLT